MELIDVEEDLVVRGNPELKRTTIENYDARLEWFPNPGELVSFGIFQKDLKDPIERFYLDPQNNIVSFTNRPTAIVRGIEFEVRKKLGFVAAKPIPQVLRNINAFTLGARSVDPSITTQVIFTGDWSIPVKEAEATNSLVDQGVDVVTCHVDAPKVVIETAEKRGIMSSGYHASQAKLAPKGYLTGAEWDWSTPYKKLVQEVIDGKPMSNFVRGGMKEGFVKMSAYGPSVSAKAKEDIPGSFGSSSGFVRGGILPKR